MSQTVSGRASSLDDLPNWKRIESKSTPNEIIDAYNKGKQVGFNLHDKVLGKFFSDNLDLACNISEDLLQKLTKELNFNCKHLFIKPEGMEDFEALYIVERADYLSGKRKDAYKLARELKSKYKKELFSINFVFMPGEDKINFSAISCDGYFLQYEPKKIPPKSRKAQSRGVRVSKKSK